MYLYIAVLIPILSLIFTFIGGSALYPEINPLIFLGLGTIPAVGLMLLFGRGFPSEDELTKSRNGNE